MPSPNVHTQAGAQRTGFREWTDNAFVQSLTSCSGARRVSSQGPHFPPASTNVSDTPASLLSPLLTLPTSLAGLKLGGFAFSGNGSPSKQAAAPAATAAAAGSDTSAVWQHAQLGPSNA